MKVLVTGAAGQLGSAMIERLGSEHAVTAWTRQDVDLTEHRLVRESVLRLAPDAIINCASYNEVDRAQDEQATALEVNALVVGTLARAAADLGATLVHFSTDFVFTGAASSPYTEEDRPEPQSVYAQSKLMGEWLAADAPRHFVFRVESLFGGPRRRSSIDRIIEAVRSEQRARVFHDRTVSPSFVADVTDATAYVLSTQPPFGLYHCVNDGHATWLDVGREIVRCLGRTDTLLQPVSVHDVPMRAPRPQYAALSNAKLARAGYAMPAWQDAIGRYLSAGERP